MRINGLYNRLRWDFTGDYHMATWVKDVPVAADFEPWVLDAFNKTVKEKRLPVDCVTCKVIALRAGPVAVGPS